ncbi:MAG: family 43 glycosylhydrolase [Actinomyces urogenitalis]|uniref:glycoside hydrolase family 43 protein n=1 Tax=Actinomyces urogenitalis TaxID=103621 RepID=UPI00290ED733|nr:family 43 glycosylhydrolase [Actinomyces urogenitalis]MDU6150646.1 family 43 glycosylhydrolase [Actinomyces urogenitalis]
MNALNTLPVLPGFYPDPSICRAEGTFWLASSSFEYLPSVPVHRSGDLVAWEQVGHAYERPSALPLPRGDAGSQGTFAPTIRHHEGTFYLVVTNMGQEPMGQRIVTTTDPEAGWSDPVLVPDTPGIDPDLAWDEEGTCHLTWRAVSFADGAVTSTITSVPIDPTTGRRLGEPVALWQGTGMRDPEGPHLYRRHGWWYLLLAEGGTGVGHCVTMARSRELTGPWEPHPANPVLTHRSTDHPVQATGHADLVPLEGDEAWEGTRFAMVHLGIRQREPFPGYHLNGRETFVVGVDWDGDWPEVDESRYDRAVRDQEATTDRSFTDAFAGPAGPVASGDEPWDLDDRWVSPGGLARAALCRGKDGVLAMTGPENAALPAPLLCARVRDEQWRAEALLEPEAGAVVELCVYLSPEHHVAVRWQDGQVRAVATVLDLSQQLGPVLQAVGPVRLWARAEPPEPGFFGSQVPDTLLLGLSDDEGAHELGRLDGRFLSSEVAGGFTGRMIGVRALAGRTRIRSLTYTTV